MRKLRSSLALQLGVVIVIAATIGVVIAVLGSGGSGDDPPPLSFPRTEGSDTTPSDAPSVSGSAPTRASTRQVFADSCGACHALRAAGTGGRVGPGLDDARPSAARVRRMIRTGSLDGVMQPRLLEGEQARRVAAYVARVAGRR